MEDGETLSSREGSLESSSDAKELVLNERRRDWRRIGLQSSNLIKDGFSDSVLERRDVRSNGREAQKDSSKEDGHRAKKSLEV